MAELIMRPLSVGEILDRSFALLRARFGALFLVGLACFVIPIVLAVGGLTDFAQLAQMGPVTKTGAQMDLALRMIGRFFWIGLVAFCGFVVARGAWVHLVSEAILGRSPGAGTALRRGISTALPMAGLSVVEGAIFFGIYLGLAVPTLLILGTVFRGVSAGAFVLVFIVVLGGIALVAWVYAGLYVAASALVLDSPTGVLHALSHAWALSLGRRGAILAIIALLAVLGLIVQLAVTLGLGTFGSTVGMGPQAMGPMTVLTFGLTALFQIVLGILGYVIQTVMYYDLRVRKEGLDLELMAGAPGHD
ncbi:MAG TPA: hypothetical protein VFI39_09575 [Gemmatimonadales bacterium]|nr:hypothetical protein [Gemmatimonadales bacterium]